MKDRSIGEILAFLEAMRVRGYEADITPKGGFIGIKRGRKEAKNANYTDAKAKFSA